MPIVISFTSHVVDKPCSLTLPHQHVTKHMLDLTFLPVVSGVADLSEHSLMCGCSTPIRSLESNPGLGMCPFCDSSLEVARVMVSVLIRPLQVSSNIVTQSWLMSFSVGTSDSLRLFLL